MKTSQNTSRLNRETQSKDQMKNVAFLFKPDNLTVSVVKGRGRRSEGEREGGREGVGGETELRIVLRKQRGHIRTMCPGINSGCVPDL